MDREKIISILNEMRLPDDAGRALAIVEDGLKQYPKDPMLCFIGAFAHEALGDFDLAYRFHELSIRHGAYMFHNLGHDYRYDGFEFDEEDVDCPACGSTQKKVVRVVNVAPASPSYGIIRPIRRWVRCDLCL